MHSYLLFVLYKAFYPRSNISCLSEEVLLKMPLLTPTPPPLSAKWKGIIWMDIFSAKVGRLRIVQLRIVCTCIGFHVMEPSLARKHLRRSDNPF